MTDAIVHVDSSVSFENIENTSAVQNTQWCSHIIQKFCGFAVVYIMGVFRSFS